MKRKHRQDLDKFTTLLIHTLLAIAILVSVYVVGMVANCLFPNSTKLPAAVEYIEQITAIGLMIILALDLIEVFSPKGRKDDKLRSIVLA